MRELSNEQPVNLRAREEGVTDTDNVYLYCNNLAQTSIDDR